MKKRLLEIFKEKKHLDPKYKIFVISTRDFMFGPWDPIGNPLVGAHKTSQGCVRKIDILKVPYMYFDNDHLSKTKCH